MWQRHTWKLRCNEVKETRSKQQQDVGQQPSVTRDQHWSLYTVCAGPRATHTHTHTHTHTSKDTEDLIHTWIQKDVHMYRNNQFIHAETHTHSQWNQRVRVMCCTLEKWVALHCTLTVTQTDPSLSLFMYPSLFLSVFYLFIYFYEALTQFSASKCKTLQNVTLLVLSTKSRPACRIKWSVRCSRASWGCICSLFSWWSKIL